jgi:hypothetical protein
MWLYLLCCDFCHLIRSKLNFAGHFYLPLEIARLFGMQSHYSFETQILMVKCRLSFLAAMASFDNFSPHNTQRKRAVIISKPRKVQTQLIVRTGTTNLTIRTWLGPARTGLLVNIIFTATFSCSKSAQSVATCNNSSFWPTFIPKYTV